MVLPGTAHAEASAPPRQAAAAPTNPLICEKQAVTGTRLGAKQVCLTQEQFAQRRMQEREAIERAQAAPCMPTTTDSQGHTHC